MKKLLLSVVLMSFAVAVQAGENKTCTGKDKAACSATQTSGCCSATAQKGMTCKGTQTKQVVLMSPKGAEQSSRMLVASR